MNECTLVIVGHKAPLVSPAISPVWGPGDWNVAAHAVSCFVFWSHHQALPLL